LALFADDPDILTSELKNSANSSFLRNTICELLVYANFYVGDNAVEAVMPNVFSILAKEI